MANVTLAPLTLALKSWLDPTVSPPLLRIANVPVVVSLVFLSKKLLAAYPPTVCALVAVPWNSCGTAATVLARVIPGNTPPANPEIGV